MSNQLHTGEDRSVIGRQRSHCPWSYAVCLPCKGITCGLQITSAVTFGAVKCPLVMQSTQNGSVSNLKMENRQDEYHTQPQIFSPGLTSGLHSLICIKTSCTHHQVDVVEMESASSDSRVSLPLGYCLTMH